MLTTLPALCRVSLISLAYFLCEKNGVEEIVRPRPPRDDPVTLIYLLNLELCEECSRTLGPASASAIGEQQLKRTQSGSSSRSGRDREQQLEAEANGAPGSSS